MNRFRLDRPVVSTMYAGVFGICLAFTACNGNSKPGPEPSPPASQPKGGPAPGPGPGPAPAVPQKQRVLVEVDQMASVPRLKDIAAKIISVPL